MLRLAFIALFFEPWVTLKAVYYRLFGRVPVRKSKGNAILLIHGNYHDETAWIPFMKKLEGTVYTVNLPSGKITDKDIDIITEKLEEIPESVVHIVGHSRGGDIAYRVSNLPKVGMVVRLGPTTHEVGANIFDIDAVDERINVKEKYGFLVDTGHLGLLYHPIVHDKVIEALYKWDTSRVYGLEQDKMLSHNR